MNKQELDQLIQIQRSQMEQRQRQTEMKARLAEQQRQLDEEQRQLQLQQEKMWQRQARLRAAFGKVKQQAQLFQLPQQVNGALDLYDVLDDSDFQSSSILNVGITVPTKPTNDITADDSGNTLANNISAVHNVAWDPDMPDPLLLYDQRNRAQSSSSSSSSSASESPAASPTAAHARKRQCTPATRSTSSSTSSSSSSSSLPTTFAAMDAQQREQERANISKVLGGDLSIDQELVRSAFPSVLNNNKHQLGYLTSPDGIAEVASHINSIMAQGNAAACSSSSAGDKMDESDDDDGSSSSSSSSDNAQGSSSSRQSSSRQSSSRGKGDAQASCCGQLVHTLFLTLLLFAVTVATLVAVNGVDETRRLGLQVIARVQYVTAPYVAKVQPLIDQAEVQLRPVLAKVRPVVRDVAAKVQPIVRDVVAKVQPIVRDVVAKVQPIVNNVVAQVRPLLLQLTKQVRALFEQ
eukprot:TRINITY_DN66358_c8_g1_i5.p1 TRINITY_DN66358_c8_g1~~TRINITY_DN66358_c8_g1_i5.p1  ORF type:complete len:464 (-),score=250.07 TRINITY_DN66358_c8_g1_i5:79-1470(-)